MPRKLKRYYGQRHLHFLTCSGYRRLPLLGTRRARDRFVKILGQVRERYGFSLVGYVVMPEHIHLLIGEPAKGTPSTVMQVLKQRVSRQLRNRRRTAAAQLRLALPHCDSAWTQFWQRRFHDFNVWSQEESREAGIHARESGQARSRDAPEGLALEQLQFLCGARRWVDPHGFRLRSETLPTLRKDREGWGTRQAQSLGGRAGAKTKAWVARVLGPGR
jgi:REP element-mobilizing transposase RayT